MQYVQLAIFLLISSLSFTPSWAVNVSPLPQLADAEQDYYIKVFDYTMDTIPAGGTYEWHSYSGMGNISVSAEFVSKSGSSCRNYTETYTIDEKVGADDGVACKRVGSEGWCRLKKDGALTCAMEPAGGVIEEKMRATKEFMARTGDKIHSTSHSWENWTPW